MSNNIDLYIQEIEISKADIKGAIQSKGVTPTGGLSSYAEAILSIPTGTPMAPLNETITESGVYNYNPIDDGVGGYNSVEINVDIDVPTFETQSKEVTIKKNGTTSIVPDSGYDGLSKVNVTVNVSSEGKPIISNGFRFTGGDMSLVEWDKYDWSGIYNFSHFFKNCTASDPSWTTAFGEHVINQIDHPICFDNMFIESQFTELDLSSWDTSKVMSMRCMFYKCQELTKINISGWSYEGLVKLEDCIICGSLKNYCYPTASMFGGCKKLDTIIGPVMIGDYSTATVRSGVSTYTSPTHFFADVPHLLGSKSAPVNYVEYIFDPASTTTEGWFSNICAEDLSPIVPILDICPNINSLAGLLSGNAVVKNLDQLKGWDTSKIKNINNIFRSCESLGDFSVLNEWDMSNVASMQFAFAGATSGSAVITDSLDMSVFTNPNGYDMTYAFYYGKIREVINCRPTTLSYTFYYNQSVRKVDIDLSLCNDLTYAFNRATNLREITFRGDPSGITKTSSAFSSIPSTGTLYYDSNYDYNSIIALLPSGWSKVPL